jgi:hypothetical protein
MLARAGFRRRETDETAADALRHAKRVKRVAAADKKKDKVLHGGPQRSKEAIEKE